MENWIARKLCLLGVLCGVWSSGQAQALVVDSVEVAFVAVMPQAQAVTLLTSTLVEEGFTLDFAQLTPEGGSTQKKAVSLRNETPGEMTIQFVASPNNALSHVVLRATFVPEQSRELLEKAADPAYRRLLQAGLKRYVELYLRDIKQSFLAKTRTSE